MPGNGKSKGKSGKKPAKLFYVYFPKGDGLVLYCPKLSDAGVRRIADLTMHLLGARTVYKAEDVYVVSCHKDPPPNLQIGENPCANDFARLGMKLHSR